MIATPLTETQALEVKDWRNGCRGALRTGWTTDAQQHRFAEGNFKSDYMYWGFFEDDLVGSIVLIGAGGLVNINHRVRIAEISLIVEPEARKSGYGTDMVAWLLAEAFGNQRLKTVHGEVYYCGAWTFWQKICEKYHAYTTELPNRQWWDGKYHDSMYFSIDEGKWCE